jgi:hypothetical protein
VKLKNGSQIKYSYLSLFSFEKNVKEEIVNWVKEELLKLGGKVDTTKLDLESWFRD